MSTKIKLLTLLVTLFTVSCAQDEYKNRLCIAVLLNNC